MGYIYVTDANTSEVLTGGITSEIAIERLSDLAQELFEVPAVALSDESNKDAIKVIIASAENFSKTDPTYIAPVL